MTHADPIHRAKSLSRGTLFTGSFSWAGAGFATSASRIIAISDYNDALDAKSLSVPDQRMKIIGTESHFSWK